MKGKEIIEKYFMFQPKTPVMLPPAPRETYIDVYLDDKTDSVNKFVDDKRRQAN